MGAFMETLKELSEKKGVIIYAIFILVVAVALGVLKYMDGDYQKGIGELVVEYGVDVSRGESLVDCGEGVYDVYRPMDNQTYICGKEIPKIDYGINMTVG